MFVQYYSPEKDLFTKEDVETFCKEMKEISEKEGALRSMDIEKYIALSEIIKDTESYVRKMRDAKKSMEKVIIDAHNKGIPADGYLIKVETSVRKGFTVKESETTKVKVLPDAE